MKTEVRFDRRKKDGLFLAVVYVNDKPVQAFADKSQAKLNKKVGEFVEGLK